MRILAATPYYEPEGGGLERYAHAILSRLVQRGHEVRCLSFTAERPPSPTIMGGDDTDTDDDLVAAKPRRVMLDGVAIERIPASVRLGNTPLGLPYVRRANEVMQRWRPDIVLVHSPVPFAAEMMARAADRAGIPYVLTYHAGRLRGSAATLSAIAAVHRRTLQARYFRNAAARIAVSRYVRDHALAPLPSTIIAPGVDTQRFHPAPAGAVPPATILAVAPLNRRYAWKGLDVLLDAFAKVQRERPEAELVLVGDGDRRDEVLARAAREGLRIRLLGRVGPEELVAAYQHATVLAHASRNDAEAFGMVLAEANACGRPVVACSVGGVPDFVVDGDNGILVPPNDAKALAAGLLRVLADPHEADALGERGRERVARDHGWDDAARRTEALLERIVPVPRPHADAHRAIITG